MAASTPEVSSVSREALHAWMVKVLHRKGMFDVDADLLVQRLFEAEHRGRTEHGLVLLGDIVTAMDLGDIDPRARTLTVIDLPATSVLDGSTGVGQVCATRAMTAAVQKAQTAGVGLVVVKNTQPCGDVRLYAEMAAREGCIGFCTTNSGKATLPASDAPLFGHHSQAWAIPAGDAVLVSQQVLHGDDPQVSYYAGERGLLSLVLTAGLAGARPPWQKKKASPYGSGAEHVCLAIHMGLLQAGDAVPVLVHEAWQRLPAIGGGWESVPATPLPEHLPLSAEAAAVIQEIAQAVRIPFAP